jgi:hypothetical protein
MKKIIFALAIMVVASLAFTLAYAQASVGNFRHIQAELIIIKTCIALATSIVLWIKIPEWTQEAKDWAQRPRWRR